MRGWGTQVREAGRLEGYCCAFAGAASCNIRPACAYIHPSTHARWHSTGPLRPTPPPPAGLHPRGAAAAAGRGTHGGAHGGAAAAGAGAGGGPATSVVGPPLGEALAQLDAQLRAMLQERTQHNDTIMQ
jgi:hypothetical protein